MTENDDLAKLRIGIIGLGKMGAALARGLIQEIKNPVLFGCDVAPAADIDGLKRLENGREVEKASDLILLCVKPADMAGTIHELEGSKQYISIAAGLSTARLNSYFKTKKAALARVMPNLSASIGKGVSAVYCGQKDLRDRALSIFSSIGFAFPVEKEDLMHAITGLSGSGPAYVFAFIHALAEGGVLSGLSYPNALEIAAHTVKNAAIMLLETGKHPSELRNQVTSPGGTTIAGLSELEKGAFHGTVLTAVNAGAQRSRELDA